MTSQSKPLKHHPPPLNGSENRPIWPVPDCLWSVDAEMMRRLVCFEWQWGRGDRDLQHCWCHRFWKGTLSSVLQIYRGRGASLQMGENLLPHTWTHCNVTTHTPTNHDLVLMEKWRDRRGCFNPQKHHIIIIKKKIQHKKIPWILQNDIFT